MAKINKVRLSGQTYDIEDSYAAKTVSLTQEQYDALVSGGTVDPNTLYVITDAEGVDLSDYWTSAQTESAITYATSGKAENSDFVAHSGDTSIHVTSSDKQNWNSKQAALTAGSGITIDAYNNISLAVPITSGSGNNSIVEGIGTSASGTAAHVEGYYSKANGVYSHSEGLETEANGNFSHTEGNHTIANNEAEHASGKYNVSNSGETDSATTLFSVGNGTSTSARHNAFEIRQNGDIYITSGGTDIKLQDNLGGGGGGGITSGEVQTMIDEATSGYTARFAEDEEVTAAGLNALNETLSGKQDTLSAGTNITIVDNVISASGGGTPTVELTQAEYDALVSGGTVQPNTYYIITDAQAIDISQYYTSAQTNSAIAAAVSGKQDTLSAGTGIEISGNVISATGGGGKAIEAGRGISITTGETADTVSFNLPISAGTGDNALVMASSTYKVDVKAKGSYSVCLNGGGFYPNYANGNHSLAEGMNTATYGNACHSEGLGTKAGVENNIQIQIAHAEGDHTQAEGTASHTEGVYTIATNYAEHASGKYNVSNSGETDSATTLFSVGNGTSISARHNAFEIRQNGDIYITSGGTDIKLQDNLGGGGEVSSAITSGDTNAVAGGAVYDKFDEVEQVTAAGLNALNDKFGGLKIQQITQSDYNALQTKDASTLYVIVN